MPRMWLTFAEIVLFAVAMLWAPHLRAAPKGCDGPPACCPATLTDHLDAPVTVKLGVLLVGLYEVEEKSGTWKADFYLTESWQHAPGFTPATEIANEVERQSEQFDATELRGELCVRTRRIHSTLHSGYNLRAFPFERQRLTLQFSDAWFSADEAKYSSRPSVSGLDAAAQEQLSNWKVTANLDYLHDKRTVQEAVGATPYDYATFSLAVRRHITFHLTRFFLPLLIIVVLAFSVFWIDPADLSSKVSIGVTCLLSAIALQFAEGGTLPEVEYLTLADRIYATCYVALVAGDASFGGSLEEGRSGICAPGRSQGPTLVPRRARRCSAALCSARCPWGCIADAQAGHYSTHWSQNRTSLDDSPSPRPCGTTSEQPAGDIMTSMKMRDPNRQPAYPAQ
jgi:hypothetical protein